MTLSKLFDLSEPNFLTGLIKVITSTGGEYKNSNLKKKNFFESVKPTL